jgi:hypothetical protein
MVTSYNGWPASRSAASIDVDKDFTAAGRKFPGGVKRGPVSVIFRYLVEQFDSRVEAVDLYDPGDEWGWTYRENRNANNLSCHSSGTAIDLNATHHPNGRRNTFKPEQVAAIHQILAELSGVVRWGGDFTGTPDEMHFEIVGTAAEVARVAGRLLQPTPDEPQEDDMQEADFQRIQAMINASQGAIAGELVKVQTALADVIAKASAAEIGETRKVPGWVDEVIEDG